MPDQSPHTVHFRCLVQAAVAADEHIEQMGKAKSWKKFEMALGLGLDDPRKFRRPLTQQQLRTLQQLGMREALMNGDWATRLTNATTPATTEQRPRRPTTRVGKATLTTSLTSDQAV
jgi:hypothetical protein